MRELCRMNKLILYTVRFDVHPAVGDEYSLWTGSALARVSQVGGVRELRVFQTAAGSPMVNLTFQFDNSDAWSQWIFHPEVQKVFEELARFSLDLKLELWEPSPMIPQPLYRAGGSAEKPAVRYLLRWDLHRETMEDYWVQAESIWTRALEVEGACGLAAFRALAGSPRVMAWFDFPDLAAWASWYANPLIHDELTVANSRFVVGSRSELWIPSPRVGLPIRM